MYSEKFLKTLKLLTSSFLVILKTFFLLKEQSKGNWALKGRSMGNLWLLQGHSKITPRTL